MVTVVPWFSREEWLETYRAAFSSDVSLWKDAKDTMLVWQARVEKLPAGIDVTLPLLQARIVEVDPTVENVVKAIFSASALQRFVTSILKLPQTKYYRTQSMHNLALEIGLPSHLVDLRNEIVHGHGGWTGGETILRALDDAYKWIKGYYWDAEFKRHQNGQSVFSRIPSEKWEHLFGLLENYSELILSDAKKGVLFPEIQDKLMLSLESLYTSEPEECMKAIISYILVPETSSDLANHLKEDYQCRCGCCVDGKVVQGVKPLLASLCLFQDSIETLLSCLIKKGQENSKSKLPSEWICLICGALLGTKCFFSGIFYCRKHKMLLEDPAEEVDWKGVVVELLEIQSEWSTDIAIKLMNNEKVNITDEQREKIRALVSVVSECSNASSSKGKKTPSQTGEDFHRVDDILSAAQHLPLGDRRKLEKTWISVAGVSTDEVSTDSAVGVLPHQRTNELLYKDLILQSPGPESVQPPNKRHKMQNSLG